MKNILIIILFLFCFCASMAQKNNEYCKVLLMPVQKEVKIFDKPNGKAIYSIINDTISENYYNLEISDCRTGWFKVKPSSILDTTKIAGWLKCDNTGIYARNYSKPLVLFELPDINSSIATEIKSYFNEMLQVIECKNGWLFVIIKLKDKIYKGWLSPSDQCPNQYSTCN